MGNKDRLYTRQEVKQLIQKAIASRYDSAAVAVISYLYGKKRDCDSFDSVYKMMVPVEIQKIILEMENNPAGKLESFLIEIIRQKFKK